MTSVEFKIPRKLIEVALPLDAINTASAREKSIRHGHPSTLHLWWARRPLAAARAVLFAQLVNDPGFQHGAGFRYGMNKADAANERQRLFKILEDLVIWENSGNEEVLERARCEIRRSWREVCELNKDHPDAATLFDENKIPAFHDPFAGGGAIPLEANRLGLESHATDLNPVAVLINKAMIEIPTKFAGTPPVHPRSENEKFQSEPTWLGTSGLAEDIRYYGSWVKDEAKKRIGHLYPEVEITKDHVRERPDLKKYLGKSLTVIAWAWARTVKSPNPAFADVQVPLAASFLLGTKPGKEAYIEPIIERGGYRFQVKTGKPKNKNASRGTKATGSGSSFLCLMSGSPMPFEYLREEGKAGRIGTRLMALVLEGERERVYLSPTPEMESIARSAIPEDVPDTELPKKALGFRVQEYGMSRWRHLFTLRQLTALTTFSNLVQEVRERIRLDAVASGRGRDNSSVSALEYANAIVTYLAFGIDRTANYCSMACTWHSGVKYETVTSTFGRHTVPMTWDFAESNPFSDASGNWLSGINWIASTLKTLPTVTHGFATQADAASQSNSNLKVVSTDPPYYDNIGYADLSDFFYIWLRRTLNQVFPTLLAAPGVPKAEELIATPFRHGGKEQAEAFFLDGMTKAMTQIANQAHPAFPVSIYYAFKQSETDKTDGTVSTGWITFLDAIIRSGFAITGTWPIRTELVGNLKKNIGALASSIVIVCRKRNTNAGVISRKDFLRELNAVMPEAVEAMTAGRGEVAPVAPVDLSQALIGPGMAVFSKYAAVLEANGDAMTVKSALSLINRFVAEEDFDTDTQFCLGWFSDHGWEFGKFGDADVLARAKGTSVEGLRAGGVVESIGSTLRLLPSTELPEDWTPESDSRSSVWELLHHMIRRLHVDGESGPGEILSKASSNSEIIRTLAYRLNTLCEREGWSQDAANYNSLILAWDSIELAAQAAGYTGTQISLFSETKSETEAPKKKTRKKI